MAGTDLRILANVLAAAGVDSRTGNILFSFVADGVVVSVFGACHYGRSVTNVGRMHARHFSSFSAPSISRRV